MGVDAKLDGAGALAARDLHADGPWLRLVYENQEGVRGCDLICVGFSHVL